MSLTISYRGQEQELAYDESTSIGDILQLIEDYTEIAPDFQKLVAPGLGLIKGEKVDKHANVEEVFKTEASRKKVTLIGTPKQKIDKLIETENSKAAERQKRLDRMRYLRTHQKSPTKTQTDISEYSKYTFGKLVALPFFPDAEKSLAILKRLSEDRGVKEVMKKYRLRVGTLTELDPASNSTHEVRRLGLNENAGEVIRLRLRTDDYDGWCNYKEIRKVLCHELTHNYHQEHDRKFWDMCNLLEKEVVALDPFGSSGHQIGSDVYDGPGHFTEEEFACDEGGWHGSTQVLGGGPSQPLTARGNDSSTRGIDIKERIRLATENRINPKRLQTQRQVPKPYQSEAGKPTESLSSRENGAQSGSENTGSTGSSNMSHEAEQG